MKTQQISELADIAFDVAHGDAPSEDIDVMIKWGIDPLHLHDVLSSAADDIDKLRARVRHQRRELRRLNLALASRPRMDLYQRVESSERTLQSLACFVGAVSAEVTA